MGSKGSQKTTQSYNPNATVGATGKTALEMAQSVAGTPYNVPVAPVADFSADQASAFANMRNLQGAASPYINAGANLMQQSAQPISGAQVGNYLNPFANFIMGGLQDIFGQQRRDTTGRLTQAAGGVGADRIALAQGNLAKQQGMAAGQTLAGIYQPALAAAQQDAARQQAAGFGLGQLGPALQQSLMLGTQGLMNTGAQQQQLEQAKLNAPYQWKLGEFAHQFQMPQWLSQLTAQTAPSLGGTTTNTYPGQSPWGTIAGLGMTALGAMSGNPGMMGSGLKGTMSGLGSGQMGGPSMGPMQMGGYQPGQMAPYSGFQWQPAPHGPGAMAPMAWSRGGAVNPYDMGQTFETGGYVDLEDIGGSYQNGGDVSGIDWDNPQPPEVAPDVADALASGAPLPDSAAPPPPPPPMIPQGQPALPPSMRSDLPPEITGGGGDAGMPPTALGFAAAPRAPIAPPPPAAMPQAVNDQSPFDLPPDPGEGSFARSPGAALMAAGLATMAAAGKRDSRGLPASPWAAIGEGGLKGVETLKAQDTAATQRRRVDLEARRLLQQAEHQRNTLSETRRYHDIMDQSRRDTRELTSRDRQDRLEHNRRQLELQRQQFEQGKTPEQMALAAQTRRLGRPLTDEEIVETISKLRQSSRNPPRPLSPEQQAIASKERELGRPLNDTEIAQVVQTVRQGPPAAPGEAPPSTILGDDDVAPNFEGATGLSGVGTSTMNAISGAFGAQKYPAEHKATRILNDLSVKTQSTLQNVAGRPSNYWLGRLESLTVKPNSWKEGPQSARDRLIQTRDTIDQEIKRVDSILQNPQTSKPDKSKAIRSAAELRGLKADYDAVIGAWGGGAGNPLTPLGNALPAPSMGQVREGATSAAGNVPQIDRPPPRPKNAPQGSRLQRSNTGKYRWVGPDGRPLEP